MDPLAAPSPAPALLSMLHAPSGHWAGTLHFTHRFLLLLQSHPQSHPRPPSAAPIPIPSASAPQLVPGLLGARCCPCALGHHTLSPGHCPFGTACQPRTLSTNPWHRAPSPPPCPLITACHPCPLGFSSLPLPPRPLSLPRGAPHCQPSQTTPACSALRLSGGKPCYSPERWALASQPAWTWGAPCCPSCCSTEGCLAPAVPRCGRVNRQGRFARLTRQEGLGDEGAAGETRSDQYRVLELCTNRSSEP